MRVTTAALLTLPLIIFEVRHSHGHGVAHSYAVARRALEVKIVTVTEVLTHSVTVGTSSTLGTSTFPPPQKAAPPAAPPAAPAAPSPSPGLGGNTYHTLMPISGFASVKNSYTYPVHVWSVGHESCGAGVQCQLLVVNSTYTEKLRTCKEGGIVLKISKTQTAEAPMQFEYTVWPDNKIVSYDISYLDCMKNSSGEKDLSTCAGHDGGIQAVGGSDDDIGCPDYHCIAGEWCDQQSYVVAKFDYKPNASVGACAVDKGIAFELCAGT